MFPDDKRYIGTIKDRLKQLPTYGTKSFSTYQEAHKAAEKLEKEYGSLFRYEIEVIEI